MCSAPLQAQNQIFLALQKQEKFLLSLGLFQPALCRLRHIVYTVVCTADEFLNSRAKWQNLTHKTHTEGIVRFCRYLKNVELKVQDAEGLIFQYFVIQMEQVSFHLLHSQIKLLTERTPIYT